MAAHDTCNASKCWLVAPTAIERNDLHIYATDIDYYRYMNLVYLYGCNKSTVCDYLHFKVAKHFCFYQLQMLKWLKYNAFSARPIRDVQRCKPQSSCTFGKYLILKNKTPHSNSIVRGFLCKIWMTLSINKAIYIISMPILFGLDSLVW